MLIRRSFQALFRNEQFVKARLFGALTFALILGSLNYQVGSDVRYAR